MCVCWSLCIGPNVNQWHLHTWQIAERNFLCWCIFLFKIYKITTSVMLEMNCHSSFFLLFTKTVISWICTIKENIYHRITLMPRKCNIMEVLLFPSLSFLLSFTRFFLFCWKPRQSRSMQGSHPAGLRGCLLSQHCSPEPAPTHLNQLIILT